jgi:hypothetical protein
VLLRRRQCPIAGRHTLLKSQCQQATGPHVHNSLATAAGPSTTDCLTRFTLHNAGDLHDWLATRSRASRGHSFFVATHFLPPVLSVDQSCQRFGQPPAASAHHGLPPAAPGNSGLCGTQQWLTIDPDKPLSIHHHPDFNSQDQSLLHHRRTIQRQSHQLCLPTLQPPRSHGTEFAVRILSNHITNIVRRRHILNSPSSTNNLQLDTLHRPPTTSSADDIL